MGGIYKGGRLSLKLFTNNMDSEFYVNILDEKCLEINALSREYKIDWILRFDNDPKHKSKLDMEFINKKKTLGLLTLQIYHQLKIFGASCRT